MNKMDEFFKQNLKDTTPAEDGWNVPSEDLWNAAKPHFPKPKKRRNKFLFLFCGLTIAILSAVYIYSYSLKTPKNNLNANNQTTNMVSPLVENELPASKTTNETQVSQPSKNDLEPIEKQKVVPNISNPSQEAKLSIDDEYDLVNNHCPSCPSTRQVTNYVASPEEQFVYPENTTEGTANNLLGTSKQAPASKSNLPTNIKLESEGVSQKLIIKSVPLMPALALNVFPLELKNKVIHAKPISSDLGFANANALSMPKLELGASYIFYPLPSILETIKNDDQHPDNRYNFIASYQNANFTISKWFAKKWSISSGLYRTKFDINVSFSVVDTVDRELEQFIQQHSNNPFNRSINNTNTEIFLEPGITIEQNDIVTLEAENAELQLSAYQIPIIINYHFYGKRFEYNLGAGPSLNHVRYSSSDYTLNIFRDGDLVGFGESKSESESEFSYNLYALAGVKYKINSNINLDLNLRIAVDELEYSGIGLGFNYRWNRPAIY